ncbi:MAG: carbon-nitrogen hydrolase family protein [Nocardioidaceae bacterium]
MRVAAAQLNSQDDKEANVKNAVEQVAAAAQQGANLVMLPEYTDYLGPADGARAVAEQGQGPAQQAFADAARTHRIWVHCGSIRVAAPDGRSYNTSIVYDPEGNERGLYRKIHLFDVDIPDGVTHRESATIAPGDDVVTCDVDGFRLGLSICYDLRFPELYQALTARGARLLAVPAAFTFFTGRDHWEVLLRARAIENQCYVIAPGQVGTHPADGGATARCNGRSMIIDPWGVVVACATDEVGIVHADIDPAQVASTRQVVPSLANRRPDVYAR